MAITKTPALAPAVEKALDALSSYTNGGSRSALLPLDAAVVRSLADPADRAVLERRLAALLAPNTPPPAKQYACGKLALIGTALSVPPLAALLADPKVAADARTALECMPDPAAAKALLAELPKLSGLQRAGVIHSLGVRRYRPAAATLKRELNNPDPLVQKAAMVAVRQFE